jgi:hypothetical protein
MECLPELWVWPEPDEAAELAREATAEIGPGHELSGCRLTTVARCSACHDVAFQLDDGTYAVVHLTYSRRLPDPAPAPGQSAPAWPLKPPWKTIAGGFTGTARPISSPARGRPNSSVPI